MGSYYEDRGELVSSDHDSFMLNDTKYRIAVRVRHKSRYNVSVGLYKIQGSTPYDRLHSKRYVASSEKEVRERVEAGTKEMREFAEEREDAKDLSVNVTSSVHTGEHHDCNGYRMALSDGNSWCPGCGETIK